MVGTEIEGYRIVRLIGEGGMGAVYEAVHTRIGSRVAVKVLRADYANDEEHLKRFFNEAKAVNLVEHPSLVKVMTHGRLSAPPNLPYLFMEYLSGQTLGKRIDARGGRLRELEAVRIIHQTALAIAAAHEKNILHRDLKPENIMLVGDPAALFGERIKVLDFGIAKLPPSGTENAKTRTGQLLGTLEYMSPEQAQEQPLNPKTDVYSLGVILYQLLAGEVPFPYTGNLFQTMLEVVSAAPPLLQARVADVSPDCVALVEQMLAKSPDKRPDMAEAAKLLGELVQLSSGSPSAPTQPFVGSGPSRRAETPRRLHPLMLALGIGLVCMLLAVVALFRRLGTASPRSAPIAGETPLPNMVPPVTTSLRPEPAAEVANPGAPSPPKERTVLSNAVGPPGQTEHAPQSARPPIDKPAVTNPQGVQSGKPKRPPAPMPPYQQKPKKKLFLPDDDP